MRKALAALLLLAATPLFAGDIPGLTSKKLANGLEVIVIENHAVPLVTIEVAVKSGGFVETPEYSGLSHLYEHMFFKGNRVIPNQEAYLKRLRELGASWNGTTSTERVNYYFTVPSTNLREGAVFMRDALFFPLFQQKELERERVVVLGEFDRNEANPQFHLGREVDRKLWYQHFSRKNVIGDRIALAKTTREQMQTLKDRYYVPNNSALLFSGDVNPAEAYALAEELFGEWKATDDPHKLHPVPPHPPLKQSSTIAVIQPVKTATVQIAWHGPSMTADVPSTFAADVLSFILSQPNSRFHRNLIDSGLFDFANVSYFSQVHTGPINAFGQTSPERLDKAHAALLNEIGHFADADYFTDEELKFAKDQLEVSEIYNRERPTDFVHTVSFWWASGGLDYYRNYLDNLRKVTRADIQNYVRRYIAGKPSVTGVLVSDENRGKIALLKNAEVVRPVSGSSATEMKAEASATPTEEFDVEGLHVILRRNPSSEVVSAKAFLQGGLAFAGRQRAGLELLMLQIAEKQSEKYPKEKMARELTRLGAQLTSGAGQDYSTFTLTCLRRSFAESMDIFLDALARPRIDDSELALARERRLSALKGQTENPDAWIERISIENIYGDHPYAANPLGTESLVNAATPKQLRDLHASTVTRSRLLLVVVGNVTRAEVESVLRPVVKAIPAGDYRPGDVAAIPNADRAATKLVARDLPTVYVSGLFPAPNPKSDDYAAMLVAMNILSDRLFEEIRTKRNLSYAAFSGLRRRAAAIGQLYVTTPDPNAAVRVIRDEVEKMRTTPVSETELKDQVRQMKTQTLMNLQAANDIAQSLGDWELLSGDSSMIETVLAKLDSVTPEQVRRVMEKHAHHVDFALLGKVDGVDTKLLESF
ncbi:MAG TPA: pitrilysin family protein [Thermoanaerobaculia bacterium]|nr:pitrilysin family protein [Thermoanaerobaculia bacterium]